MTAMRALIALAAMMSTAGAEPRAPVTAADVADAPPPGHESGRTDEVDPGDSSLRVAARGALFVPKVAVDVLLAPLRTLVWANDRYKLEALYHRVFFNDAQTIGLYPTATFQSGFGIEAGARFVHRDLFGQREHVGLQATYGGSYHAGASAALKTGDRLGERVGLELEGTWSRRPNEPFYGIGNIDMDETHYRIQQSRVRATGDVTLVDGLHLRTNAAVTDFAFSSADAGPIAMGSVDHVYGELEVRWDERHRVTQWEPRATYAAGWLATAFTGRVHRLDDGPDFWHYGAELQHFLRLGGGPRVFATRFHTEAVSGSRDEVPFIELPSLGGSSFLRGYSPGRFRDRVSAMASIEYMWDLSHYFDASMFVDVGRVFPSVAEVTFDHLRLGYGVALQLHSDKGFVVAGSVASSIDGGLYFSLSFNPVFDSYVRWR